MPFALRPLAVAVAVAAVSLASCSSRYDGLTGGEATGKVTLDGRPVTAGTVVFIGASESTAAEIRSDGSYHAQNVPLGPVRVSIVTTGPSVAAKGGQGPPPQTPPPPRYCNAATSGLELTVSTGSHTFDIPMTTR
jgi:hypothetical protein